MSCTAFAGGTILIHSEDDSITAVKADLIVDDDRIMAIGDSLKLPAHCEILDCKGKIISPGLISTHNHLWEVPLKGICEDMKAVPYFATMFTAGLALEPRDVFWSTLAGALESINAGTTTVLDFAHGNCSKDHSKQAIAGTLSSGIRGVHAFSPAIKVTQTKPEVKIADLIPTWFVPTLQSLAKSSPFNSKQSRLQLGLGFDYFFLDKTAVCEVFEKARCSGIKTFTSHSARVSGNDDEGLPALLKAYGLLGPGYVISHMTGATKEDIEVLYEAGAHISSSPTMELAMGMGTPVCFRRDVPKVDKVCSLGVDCMYSSVVNEMRVGLQAARASDLSSPEARTCHEAFNMGTIQGARALGSEKEIGSIAVGKKADLVIWNASSPAMLAAAQYDPVKAIVMHSSVADVDAVVVDGKFRKKNGKLTTFQYLEWQDEAEGFVEVQDTLTWDDVIQPVLRIQSKIVSKWPEVDFEHLEAYVKSLYKM